MHLYESFYPRAANDFLFHNIIRRDEACFTPAGAFTVHEPHERGFEVRFSVNTWNGTVVIIVVNPCLVSDRLTAQRYVVILSKCLVDLHTNVPLSVWRSVSVSARLSLTGL
jgi:hypothetical protein